MKDNVDNIIYKINLLIHKLKLLSFNGNDKNGFDQEIIETNSKILGKSNDYKVSQCLNSSKKFNPGYFSSIIAILYLITSLTTLISLIVCNFIDNKNKSEETITAFPVGPFPNFLNLCSHWTIFFPILFLLISILGLINIWFYCVLLLQRYSVPELSSKKTGVHFMFVLGILSNILLTFFGFAPDILRLETIAFKNVKISITAIIYLTSIFFNILFAVLALRSIQSIKSLVIVSLGQCKNKSYKEKISAKKCVIYLAVFTMLIYIGGIILKSNIKTLLLEKDLDKNLFSFKNSLSNGLDVLIVLLPYVLFVINAFINLGYYYDIVYIENNLSKYIDQEYFASNDEVSLLIS